MGLFGKNSVEANSAVVAWGSLGNGMVVAHRAGSSFLNSLRKTGFDLAPARVVSPSTVARCKNALSLQEFNACRDELDRLLKNYVPGSVYTVSAVGTGGGTANFGILITRQLRQMTEYLALRVYLTHEIFQRRLGHEEMARKYINSNVQLSLIGKKLSAGLCSVEMLSMPEMLNHFGKGYSHVDVSMQECMNVLVACSLHPASGFDLEDVLSNPEFRVRTYGYQEIDLLNRYEAMVTRILTAINDLNPLMSSRYFSNDGKRKVTRAPVVVVAGHPDIVLNVQDSFSGSHNGASSLKDVEKILESPLAASGDPTIVPFPLDIGKVHLAAIYPVDQKWFEAECSAAKKKVLELNHKAQKNSSGSLLSRVFKAMLSQAGSPRLDDFLEA